MNKDRSKENQTQQFAKNIWNFCEKIVSVTWYGLKPFIQKSIENPFPAISILGGGYYLIIKMAQNALHLKFLNRVWPDLFSGKFLAWLLHFQPKVQANFIFFGSVWMFIVFLGAKEIYQRRKIKEIFESIGLINRFGVAPVLVYKKQLDQYREFMLFHVNSIGNEAFE